MTTIRNTRIDPRITARHAPITPRRARRIKALPKLRPAVTARPVLRCCWQQTRDGSGLVMAWTCDPGQGIQPGWVWRRPDWLNRLRSR
jgi:hypothetical protein